MAWCKNRSTTNQIKTWTKAQPKFNQGFYSRKYWPVIPWKHEKIFLDVSLEAKHHLPQSKLNIWDETWKTYIYTSCLKTHQQAKGDWGNLLTKCIKNAFRTCSIIVFFRFARDGGCIMARIEWWFLSRWPITTAAFDTPLLHSLLEYIRYNPTVKDFKCTSTIVFICQHIRYLLHNKNKSRNKDLGIFAAIYKYERSRLERLPWRLEQRFDSAKRGRIKKNVSNLIHLWQSMAERNPGIHEGTKAMATKTSLENKPLGNGDYFAITNSSSHPLFLTEHAANGPVEAPLK